jgi:hypothetical protein
MWVRFKAAGLPAGVGLDALSPGSMAGVAVSDFALPILLNGLVILATNSHVDAYSRSVVRAVRAGEVPPEPTSRAVQNWARGFGASLWKHQPIRVLAYIALVPVYLINIPYLILQRFRLSLLWFVIAVPFEPSLVVLVVAVAAALKWADYVFAQAPDTPVGIRRARTLATVGFIVAASCGAVAGEANPGPHFPTAVVRMADGSSLSGAYVAYSGGTLYLGEGHAIHVVPGRQLAGFSVHDTPDHTQLPTSLLVRGVDLVADVFPN